MASAAVRSAAMSIEGKEVVHPFFLKAKAINTSPIVEGPQPEPQATLAIEDAQAESQPPEPRTSKENGAKRRKRRSGSMAPKQATLDRFSRKRSTTPVEEPAVAGELTGVIYSPRGSIRHEEVRPDEEIDYWRRHKRQKTVTPEPTAEQVVPEQSGLQVEEALQAPVAEVTPSWEDQLRAEAERVAPNGIEDSTTEHVRAEMDDGAPVAPELPATNGAEEQPEATGDELQPEAPERQEPDLSLSCDGAADKPDQASKPAKMLQLKNGRLASPPKLKSAPPLIESEPEKKTRGKRNKKKEDDKAITVIKYPDTSPDWNKFGSRIGSILDGSERFTQPGLKTAVKLRVSPRKPAGPPKSTHPFFMGRAALKAATEPEAKQTSPKKVAEKVEIRMPHSPRKMTGTPGKLRAEAEAHRATMATLNPPSFGRVFGSSFQPRTKYHGMKEAPFPWQGAVHTRGEVGTKCTKQPEQNSPLNLVAHRKLKHTLITVNDSENLVRQCSRGLYVAHTTDVLRKPSKVITSGPGIQGEVAKQLVTRFKADKIDSSDSEGPSMRRKASKVAPHPALQRMYDGIETELTPFDKYECETQAWTQKYAPQSAAEVLQPGKEAVILRDWLRSTTITAVDTGNRPIEKALSKLKPEKRKKRKRAEEMDDFIADSDDELAAAGELTGLDDEDSSVPRSPAKRSLVRGGGVETTSKSGNAILVSGPSGCGKTAAVYAVAKELGFEVFELNAGSRRSGKDVLDKIGDMTENHLVQQVSKALSENKTNDSGRHEAAKIVESGVPDSKQDSVTSFFNPAINKKKPTPKSTSTKAEKQETKPQPRQQQRQSLILLEEVDILFEEDKQFWVTVLTLASNSKRPIIMTCNDETRLPMHTLSLHAILRFTPPPVDLAVDYLLLMTAREGHLLQRKAVKSLYQSRRRDLRASIMDLGHWCQMGVGDSTGGFEWMLDRYPPGIDIDDQGRTMRVASRDTYLSGMGLISRDLECTADRVSFDRDEALLLEAADDWGLRPEDVLQPADVVDEVFVSVNTIPGNVDLLKMVIAKSECASAMDVSCSLGFRTGFEAPVDATLPDLTEKAKASYEVDIGLFHAEPPPDCSNFNKHLAIGTSLRAHRAHTTSNKPFDQDFSSQLLHAILNRVTSSTKPNTPIPRQTFSAAFDCLAESTTLSTQPFSSTYPLTASSFDREFSILALDLAPYIRIIASYDLQLEEQRLKLSSLLSAGGRGPKKVRTTRASRSAAEGGKRENTRRERWFGKEVNLRRIMETGGVGRGVLFLWRVFDWESGSFGDRHA
ncbi:hypothetical protein EJ08DRAFT_131641 [Tothia fuscella]|uniref:AAA+ ATPase domain-containing protein n=1 Tax=Tothia fuscella TaxID=1048955 RepID=A0A9P4U0X4_9PEZI|nr:hypothetical protein EJ08DRAFT_131641 [Tothia fuscella]